MTPDERLALIRVKVERAKKHLRDLNFAVDRFRWASWVGEPGPYEIATKRDPNTRKLIYYIASVREVPPNIRAITGDVLQNCRTALDHLVHQLFLVNNLGAQPNQAIGFPIFDDLVTYQAKATRKVRGLRDDAITAIESIRPYKGGNDILWRLHRLNNVDKHRLLLAVTCAYQGRSITESDWPRLRELWPDGHPALQRTEFIAAPRQDWNRPLRAGYEFYVAPPDSETNQDMQLSVDITFAEPQIISGETIIEALQRMIDWVDAIICDFRRFLA